MFILLTDDRLIEVGASKPLPADGGSYRFRVSCGITEEETSTRSGGFVWSGRGERPRSRQPEKPTRPPFIRPEDDAVDLKADAVALHRPEADLEADTVAFHRLETDATAALAGSRRG